MFFLEDAQMTLGKFRFLAPIVATLLLVACVTAPKSYTERIAAAYSGIAITDDTIAILANAGTISKEQGREAVKQVKQAREAVDVATTFKGPLGEDKLQAALDLLRAAQDYLCKDKPTEPNCVYLRSQP
jgi:hypothetical protein